MTTKCPNQPFENNSNSVDWKICTFILDSKYLIKCELTVEFVVPENVTKVVVRAFAIVSRTVNTVQRCLVNAYLLLSIDDNSEWRMHEMWNRVESANWKCNKMVRLRKIDKKINFAYFIQINRFTLTHQTYKYHEMVQFQTVDLRIALIWPNSQIPIESFDWFRCHVRNTTLSDTEYLQRQNIDRHWLRSTVHLWIQAYRRWDPLSSQNFLIFPNARYPKWMIEWEWFHLKWKRKNWFVENAYLRKYCCRAHMTTIHRVMVVVFDLFSAHTDTTVNVFSAKFSCIDSSNSVFSVVKCHWNGCSIDVDSSPATLYARIPILDERCNIFWPENNLKSQNGWDKYVLIHYLLFIVSCWTFEWQKYF